MELKEDSTIIKIFPNKAFASKIILEQRKKGGYSIEHFFDLGLKEGIYESNDLSHLVESFDFAGISGKEFKTYEEANAFKTKLEAIVTKSLEDGLNMGNIDNILFILYLHANFTMDVESIKMRYKYLDELITLYVELKQKTISIKNSSLTEKEKLLLERKNFDNLEEEERLQFISSQAVKINARMLGTDNKLLYVPDDFNIVLKRTNCDEDITVPERLASQFRFLMLQEIVQQHEKYNTKFYRFLLEDNQDLSQLMTRSKYSDKRKYKNTVLADLILEIEKYLNEYNNGNSVYKKTKYEFIFRILNLVGLLNSEGFDKNQKIEDILIDSSLDPDNKRNRDRNRGKTQYFK